MNNTKTPSLRSNRNRNEFKTLEEIIDVEKIVFSFPRDLIKILDAKIPIYHNTYYIEGITWWEPFSEDVIHSTINLNANHFTDPIFNEVFKKRNEAIECKTLKDIWIEVNKCETFVDVFKKPCSNGKSQKPKNELQTKDILAVAIKILFDEIIKTNKDSKLTKTQKSITSPNGSNLAKEVINIADSYWLKDQDDDKREFGYQDENIKNIILQAIKFTENK